MSVNSVHPPGTMVPPNTTVAAPPVALPEKHFSLPVAAFLIILTMAAVYVAGMSIGKAYFWQDVDVVHLNQQLTYYRQMVREKPDDPQERVNLGFAYFQLGQVNEAISNYEVALKIYPGYYPAYLNLGYAYYQKKEYDEALDAFNQAAKLNPNDYKAHLNLGIVFTELDMFDQAESSFEKALLINRSAADVYYHSGQLYEKMGDYDTAAEAYEEALKFDPQFQEPQAALRRLGS